MQLALRDDALSSTERGFELRVGLPWIRSLPLAGLSELTVVVDGQTLEDGELGVALGERHVTPGSLAEDRDTWWYLQDRLVVAGPRRLAPGRHAVSVDFRIVVPYLPGGPDAPLVLPTHLEAVLDLDHPVVLSAARDVS
ncbi:DUF6379 domain-containing protein [Actinoplanes sp. NPDC051470]|uniref:C-glycoside deglycosidase beta subunit domain-containing protein n=1 Tax=unclassified Actinoplanes TaxID=2626549 RepID=UPI00342DF333